MRFSTILWSLIPEEKANLVKRFLLLSFILTRLSNEIEGLSSSSVSFGERGDSPFDQSTPHHQLFPFHHHHRINHHHNHHNHHNHHRRHHHGSKSISGHQHNQPPPLPKQLIDQQLTNHELDSILSSRPSSDGVNKSTKSDGAKPCASCASLDEKLFVKLKLEAIKTQILSKLHLDTQPNVTSELSDSMVIDALLESKSIQLRRGDVSSPLISPSPHQSSTLSSPLISSSTVSQSPRGSPQPQPSQSLLGKSQSNTNSNPRSDKVNELPESTDDDYYGTTSEIISFPEPGIQINGHTLLEFALPSTNIDSLDAVSAKLWIKVEPWGSNVPRKPSESQRISLFIFAARNISTHKQDIESTNGTLSSIPGVYFDQILMKKIPASTGWKQLDLTNEVQRWFTSTNKLSLMIDCSGCEGKLKFLLFDPNESKLKSKSKDNSGSYSQYSNSIESSGKGRKDRPPSTKKSFSSSSPLPGSQYRPYLIINTRPKNLKRMKRDFPSTCDPNFRHCCVQQLFVNFTHLGWDSWIISPSGYYAGYCAGNCLKPIKTPEIYAWYHSYVMDHYREANPYASISPCCTPTRLEPLQIMHWVGNSAIISNLPNMIVKECGCS